MFSDMVAHPFREILLSPDQTRAQKIVLKLAGTACNIDCSYCGEKEKDLKFDHRFMTPEQLTHSVKRIDRKVDLLFHGGEPLLVGLNRFRALLEATRALKEQVQFVGVQTNGTLLSPAWTELFFSEFKDLGIEVSISLDGPRELNRLRTTYSGRSTWDATRRGFQLLEDVGQSAGLLSVIGRHALEHEAEYVEFLSSIPNLRFAKINPLFDVREGHLTLDSISPDEFTRFLQRVAEQWVSSRAYERYPIEPLLSFIQVLEGVDSKYCIFNQRKCLNYSTIYPDGSTSICDNFSVKDFAVPTTGNSNFMDQLRILAVGEKTHALYILNEKCTSCQIYAKCSGGCLSQRLALRQAGEHRYEEYCRRRSDMFTFMAQLVGKQEPV